MATVYSNNTGGGDASATSTWALGVVPVEGDDVVVRQGDTVTLDGTYIWGGDATTTGTLGASRSGTTVTVTSITGTPLRIGTRLSWYDTTACRITALGTGTGGTGTYTVDTVLSATSFSKWHNSAVTPVGTLKWSRAVNSSLTVKGNLDLGSIDLGTEADPIPDGVVATLKLNYSDTMVDAKYGMSNNSAPFSFRAWGKTQKRITTLTAAAAASDTTIYVADATGYAAGDVLYLLSTTAANQKCTTTTIHSSYAGGTTIPLVAGLTNAHKINCPLVNLSTNVKIKEHSALYAYTCALFHSFPCAADSLEIGHCTIDNAGYAYPYSGFAITQDANYTATLFPDIIKKIESVVFMNEHGPSTATAITAYSSQHSRPLRFDNCACLDPNTTAGSTVYLYGYASFFGCIYAHISNYSRQPTRFEDCWSYGNYANHGYMHGPMAGMVSVRTKLVGYVGSICYAGVQYDAASDVVEYDIDMDSLVNFAGTFADTQLQSCGSPIRRELHRPIMKSAMAGASLDTCKVMTANSYVKCHAINGDTTKHEWFFRDGIITRENTLKYRAGSSITCYPTLTNRPFTLEPQDIFIPPGETLRIIGYVRYDSTHGASGLVGPTVTLSGVVAGTTLTPASYSAPSSQHDTWHKYDLSITNSTASAGTVTLNRVIQSASISGKVYWSGTPYNSFVTICRHYGFLFDETLPGRTVNATVVATEAAASAYTGATITWGASVSPVALTTNLTYQYLYDLTQYQSCENIASAVPLTGAGVAGAPSLAAMANITATSFTLAGAGNILLGSFTLSGLLTSGGAYTYTGGVLSSSTAAPSLSGGTLTIGAAVTGVFGADGTIVICTPTAPGTYDLRGASLGGTTDLRNASGTHAITVRLQAGVAYTIANNTGAAITVDNSLSITIAAPNILDASRVRLYNLDAAAELDNSVVTGGYSFSLVSGEDYTVGDQIVLLASYQQAGTAKRVLRLSATANADNITFTDEQVDWTGPNVLGIDGSDVPECTTDYIEVQVEVDDDNNATAKSRIAAFVVDAITSENGIRRWVALDGSSIVKYDDSGAAAVIDVAIAGVSVINVKAASKLVVDDLFGLSWSDGTDNVSAVLGSSIIWKNPHAVYTVETGVSGLTAPESALLLALPDASTVATAVRANLATELGRMDAAVTTRSTLDSTAAQAASAAAIAAASLASQTSVSAIPTNPLLTNDARLDAIATRASQASVNAIPTNPLLTNDARLDAVAAIQAKTDALPAVPASEATAQSAVNAASLAAALSA